jgi:Uma2 family endonuclease
MSTIASLPTAPLPTSARAPLALGASTRPQTIAELVQQLGDIPLDRIRTQPPPGTATLADVIECEGKQGCLCELVDGVLVEKAMGYREGLIEMILGAALVNYNRVKRLGVITSASSMHQLQPNLVRLPDIGYAFWSRFPQGRVTDDPVPRLAPDVAVEVLSPSNTRGEMERKRAEYFAAGTQLVWMVDLDERTITVYTAPDRFALLRETDTLDGGQVLPGFSLPLNELFAELDQAGPQAASKSST